MAVSFLALRALPALRDFIWVLLKHVILFRGHGMIITGEFSVERFSCEEYFTFFPNISLKVSAYHLVVFASLLQNWMWFLPVLAPEYPLFLLFAQLSFLLVANTGKAWNIGRCIRSHQISGGVWCSRCCEFGLRPLPFREQMGDEAANFLSQKIQMQFTSICRGRLCKSDPTYLQFPYWTLSAFWGTPFSLLRFKYDLRNF